MSIFSFLGSLFSPLADTIDNLHDSEEELGQIAVKKAELRNKLAEIEAKVSTKMMELQSQSIEANAKMAVAEQQHGNTYVKAVRPTIMLGSFLLIVAMGFEIIPYKSLILQICGGYLGFYGGLRTWEKKK